ncbi:MAG: hypothetical protein EAZ54_00785 [Curvibacter sp.]|nr:MAG: hypothetical protein EAZ54_00785 [Curvibacter sp.]
MTISTLSFSLLEYVLPLKWLAGNHHKARTDTVANHKSQAYTAQYAIPFVAAGAHGTGAKAPSRLQPTPLRIVRVVERGQSRSHVGRMVISGRMADVCAELDRLAACEAA